jgi:hypothetical protein
MGGTVSAPGRLGLAALVLALVGNIPIIAATIIFAILFGLIGGNGSVFESLFGFLAVIGPVVPLAFGALSLTALALGIAATVRGPGRRDGITAIVIVVVVPLLAFGVLGALILF